MSQHTTTDTSPARHHQPTQPRLLHLIHHREIDGTTHTMCGLTLPHAVITVRARRGDTCPACQAAAHLLEVMP